MYVPYIRNIEKKYSIFLFIEHFFLICQQLFGTITIQNQCSEGSSCVMTISDGYEILGMLLISPLKFTVQKLS